MESGGKRVDRKRSVYSHDCWGKYTLAVHNNKYTLFLFSWFGFKRVTDAE